LRFNNINIHPPMAARPDARPTKKARQTDKDDDVVAGCFSKAACKIRPLGLTAAAGFVAPILPLSGAMEGGMTENKIIIIV
jgi:hypothetical protein